MKHIACLALTAIWLVVGSAYGATARCVAYGDDKTDFTWRLCPGGEKNMSGNTSTSALGAISIGLRGCRSLQVVAGSFELDLS